MNEYFSGERFRLLILQHWADNRKRYLLSLLAYIGVLVLWFLVAVLVNNQEPFDQEFQIATYYFSLFALGTTYASQYFGHFGSKAKGINFLMTPASQMEKLLCSLLYSVVFFLVVFTAAYYLVDVPTTYLMKDHPSPSGTSSSYGLANVFAVEIFEYVDRARGNLLIFYLAVQSVFLFGSVLFNKYSFLKTCIGGLVFLFVTFILVYLGNKAAFDSSAVTIFPGWVREMMVILTWITPVFFWVLTYFRLKAKQV